MTTAKANYDHICDRQFCEIIYEYKSWEVQIAEGVYKGIQLAVGQPYVLQWGFEESDCDGQCWRVVPVGFLFYGERVGRENGK